MVPGLKMTHPILIACMYEATIDTVPDDVCIFIEHTVLFAETTAAYTTLAVQACVVDVNTYVPLPYVAPIYRLNSRFAPETDAVVELVWHVNRYTPTFKVIEAKVVLEGPTLSEAPPVPFVMHPCCVLPSVGTVV